MKQIHNVNSFIRLALACSLLAIASCSPKVDNNGYISESDIKTQVEVGKSSKDDVKSKLGSPSAVSSFGDETWYYITARKEGYAFLKPEVVSQKVVSIAFDNNGLVSKVGNYDETNSKEFDIVKRSTPTEGHTLGFFEQILGNIGRFNHPSNDSVAAGRKTSGGYR